MQVHSQNEFSRWIALGTLPEAGRTVTIEANGAERAALASRFGILAIDELRAEGTFGREGGSQRIRLTASLRARVTHACVVTLEPFEATIESRFERLYAQSTDAGPTSGDGDGAEEAFVDLNDDLFVEGLEGDGLDLGEVVAEQLALELDPYPRAPGARFEPLTDGR